MDYVLTWEQKQKLKSFEFIMSHCYQSISSFLLLVSNQANKLKKTYKFSHSAAHTETIVYSIQCPCSNSICYLLVYYYFQVFFSLLFLLFCNPSFTRPQVWLRHPGTSPEVTMAFWHTSSVMMARCLQKTFLPLLKSTEHNVTDLFTQITLLLWDMFPPVQWPALLSWLPLKINS